MKTPRELLLARHAGARMRLDALRREVVAEHVCPLDALEPRLASGGLTVFWRQFVWSGRWAWSGLALAWVTILGLHLAADGPVPLTARSVPAERPAGDLRLALTEQARLRASLLESSPPLAPQTPRRGGGPRSEKRLPNSPTTA
ncbi:MAG TPA: hypothetical protein PK640_08260 [Verrucomicrobiota bacterium]|nr:hypothetical protein [Verrucomicrobiota bacterium]